MGQKILSVNQPLTVFTAENFPKYFANFVYCEKSKVLHALWTNGWLWLFASRKSVAKNIFSYSWIFFEYTAEINFSLLKITYWFLCASAAETRFSVRAESKAMLYIPLQRNTM